MPVATRRQYPGAAVATTTTGSLAAGGTTVSIAATTGWPSGATQFYVVLNPGTATEEKCLATRAASVLTLTRGQDGTTAQSHASGVTVYPIFAAADADDANRFLSVLTTRGDLLTINSTPDPARLAIGAANTVLRSNGTDPSWGQVATANIADQAVSNAKITDNTITTAKLVLGVAHDDQFVLAGQIFG